MYLHTTITTHPEHKDIYVVAPTDEKGVTKLRAGSSMPEEDGWKHEPAYIMTEQTYEDALDMSFARGVLFGKRIDAEEKEYQELIAKLQADKQEGRR